MSTRRVRAVIVKEGKTILIKRIKKDVETYWVFPGGGVEAGENDVEALTRECFEELGVAVSVADFFMKYEYDGYENFYYICHITGGVLGSGQGPEYQAGTGYEGVHEIALINVADLSEINVRPTEVRDKVSALWLQGES